MKRTVHADVVVLGAGAIGAAAALRLASKGLDVVLVDRGHQIREAASLAAAGILSPQAEASGPGPLLTLMRRGRERWAAFAEEVEQRSGLAVGWRKSGTLLVAEDDGEAEKLVERERWQTREGLRVERLDGSALMRLEPALAQAAWALRFPDEAQVEPRRLMAALTVALERAGVRRVHAEVRRIETVEGRFRRALCDDVELCAAHAVVSLGSWASRVEGVPLETSALEPVRGQLIELRSELGPRHVVFGAGGYLVPRGDGRILSGSTEEWVGFEDAVTSSAVDLLRVRAAKLCPALREAQLVEAWSGLRPRAIRTELLLGPTDIAGLHLACGHYRSGILLCPLSADLIADSVLGAPLPDWLAPFLPKLQRQLDRP
jgi:glycine oxidase